MTLHGLRRGLLPALLILMSFFTHADELGRGFVGVPQILNQPDPSVGPKGVLVSPPPAPTAAEPVTLPAPAPLPQNEFQRFVEQATGQTLPLFGHNLFGPLPSTFAPVDRVPVPADYVIGPGDEILLRAWGQLDMNYRASVDRNGQIHIPKVGSLNVAGLTYRQLPGFLQNAIGRVFRNFELNVSLGELRSIQVFVVGHARRPGSYTVSSLSTLVNALFASGGPSATGSMRRIQLKRHDQVVTEFDLYDLLARGDKSKDARLMPGDVIYIPPVGPMVALYGSVNTPAVYELKGDSTLADLFGWAGGLSTLARGQKVTVERIVDRAVRQVAEFGLDDAGLARRLNDGDLVRVYALSMRLDNAVTLRGNVAQPARFPWRAGMRVRDVIPDRESLLTPDYWQRRIAGIVSRPGDEAGLRQQIRRADDEINWDYAVIERIDRRDLSTSLIPFDLGRAVLENDPAHNLPLEPGDTLTVFSKRDIRVPATRQTHYVTLEGEFVRPGVYRIEPGETLRQLVARTGGLTADAYLYGAEFLRESTRREQQERFQEIVARMERDFEESARQRARSVTSPEEAAALKVELEAQRERFRKLRTLQVKGRIALEMAGAGNRLTDLPDLPLEDGDRFIVGTTPSTVSVFGAVNNEGAFLYRPDRRVGDYLALAGGVTRFADNRNTFLLRADGSAISRRDTGILSSALDSHQPRPGDTIVVPEDTERSTWVKSLKDWTQIFYQFGLGAAAIRTLK
jgi:protein involved in polysaccharide export with SLBB domain